MKKFNLFIIFLIIFLFSAMPCSVVAYTPENTELQCKSVIVANLDTDEILYSENVDKVIYPASITKIMTAIVVLETCKDIETETAEAPRYIFDLLYGANASTSGIQPGEVMTVKDLLACLLIPSGNDAALILADHFGNGSVDSFVAKMNSKAKEIGMVNTHFVTPHGLHNDDHYITAKDAYLMTRYALNLPVFKDIVSQPRYTLKKTNMSKERIIATTNSMMDKAIGRDYYYGSSNGVPIVNGVKTGYTESAGHCLICTASYKGVNLLTVCMGGAEGDENYAYGRNYAFDDTEKLLDWIFFQFEYKTMLKKEEQLKEIGVTLSNQTDTLILYPEKEITSFVPSTVEPTSVKIKFEGVPESVQAPIADGDIFGEAVLYLADKEIGRVNLVARDSVSRDYFLYAVNMIYNVVTSKFFLIPFCLIVIIVILYIVITIKLHKRKKKQFEYIGRKNRNKHIGTDRYTRD